MMFGLTKREQRWKAEQKVADTLAPLIESFVKAHADIRIAEAEAETQRLKARIAELEAKEIGGTP